MAARPSRRPPSRRWPWWPSRRSQSLRPRRRCAPFGCWPCVLLDGARCPCLPLFEGFPHGREAGGGQGTARRRSALATVPDPAVLLQVTATATKKKVTATATKKKVTATATAVPSPAPPLRPAAPLSVRAPRFDAVAPAVAAPCGRAEAEGRGQKPLPCPAVSCRVLLCASLGSGSRLTAAAACAQKKKVVVTATKKKPA